MRIAFLNPNAALGGAERSLLDIMSGLRLAQPGWSLRLIAAAPGPLIEEARALGVDARVLPFPPSLARLGDAEVLGLLAKAELLMSLGWAAAGFAAYVRALRSLLRDLEPDVLDCNGFKMHILGRWAKPPGAALLWHVHDFVSSRPAMARLMRLHSRKDTFVVANSASVAEDFKRVCPDRGPVRAVHYGIDLDRFSPDGPVLDLDGSAGLPPAPAGTLKVGLAATLARWKGQEVFLKALSLLPRGLPVRGYVIGGDIYATRTARYSLEELRGLAAGLGLADRVGFTGFIREPAAALRALDVVVHASTRPEPFGRVIMEAMACAKAVVASPLGGAAELIDDGEDALGHAPGDAASLAEVLLRLAGDPDLRAALGKAGAAKARARFGARRMTAELIPIYETLEARRGGCAAWGNYSTTSSRMDTP